MKLFFFGTLMDADVCDLVCGRRLDRIEPATVRGFRRVYISGSHYPMLLRHPLGWVDGVLVRDVDARTVHRLQVYEGWEYDLHPLQVHTSTGETVMAHVFMCTPRVNADIREWRLDQWQRRHKRTTLTKTRRLLDKALRSGRKRLPL